MPSRLALFVVILFLNLPICAQTADPKKPSDDTAKLAAEAVEFLRESIIDVGNLRTLENRVSFGSEMASLMWFHDAKEAKAMFQAVISDFRQLTAQYDAQLNALPATGDDPDDYYGGMSFLMPNRSERARILGDIAKAMALRQQIALAIAEHDPEFAFDFVDDTALVVTNAAARKQLSGSHSSVEARLLTSIAEKDPAKALEKARRTLARGYSNELIQVLKKVYEKDADKGAEFAEEIVSRIKSESVDSLSASDLRQVLETGAENLDALARAKGKRPMFKQESLRNVADLLAQILLKKKDVDQYSAEDYISMIERFAPARAAQVRTKLSPKGVKALRVELDTPPPPPPPGVLSAPSELSSASGAHGAGVAVPAGAAPKVSADAALEELGGKGLSAEERAKIVQRSRKSISGMKTPEEKLLALNVLAARVAEIGDKDLAVDVMADAQTLVNPSPKTYLDFARSWVLASGYAKVAPEKAFPILDEAILRLNDTLAAFIKVAEFVDVNNEIVEDGEIQLGILGGEMTRQMITMLAAADTTMLALAKSDFRRTRALTNRFDRTEVRILAKLLVLRAVLGPKAIVTQPETDGTGVVFTTTTVAAPPPRRRPN